MKKTNKIIKNKKQFNWLDWDIPVITEPVDLRTLFEKMNLINKKIKSFKLVGHIFGETYDEWSLENCKDKETINKAIQIDEPFLIKFSDGDVFAIDFCDFSTVKCCLNSLDYNIKGMKTEEFVDVNTIFSDLIGGKIIDVGIEDTSLCNCCFHTGSYSYELNRNQIQYINKITIYIEKGSKDNIYQLVFSVFADFGEVYITTHNDGVLKMTYKELRSKCKYNKK